MPPDMLSRRMIRLHRSPRNSIVVVIGQPDLPGATGSLS